MSTAIAGVVVLLAATAATMAGLQLPAAVAPPPVSEVVTPDGIRLHYEISGKGPTIVVLQGGPI